jgi:hypothetical protein
MMNILKAIGLTALGATLCIATAATAAAQGSRKDDVVFGPTGRPMAGASVAICTEPATTTTTPCSTLAALYSNSALTQSIANPLSTDGLGNYFFYAAPGKYTIQIYGPGITTRILPDVILPSDPSAPTFTSVTTTSGISAFSLSLAGNLSVTGSTAVAGTLTVGGSAIPTASEANTWTANQSFKGPIPYWDVTAWGASGSNATTTGTIAASGTTLTLASAQDFANGQGVMVLGAGPASSLAAPAGLAAIAVATTGSTSHTYKVVACDSAQGCSANSSVTVTNANATLSATNYIQGAFTPVAGAKFYAAYKDGAAWETFTADREISPVYAIGPISRSSNVVTAVVNQNCAECNLAIPGSSVTVAGVSDTSYDGTFTVTSATYVTPSVYDLVWSQTGLNSSSTGGTVTQPQPFYDRGAGAVANWPINVPATPPSSATPQWYVGSIVSGAGTTSLSVTPAATTAVSAVTVYHDDTAAFNAALNACATAVSGPWGAGGMVFAPRPEGNYYAFGVLNFPAVATSYGETCALKLVGQLIVGNTVAPQAGWSFEGLGGWASGGYARTPQASIASIDDSVMPLVLRGSGGNISLKNLNLGQYTLNGPCFEATYGGITLDNVSCTMSPTSYGPAVFLVDACCWNVINGGSFISNGIDDAIWIAGTGEGTPSNIDHLTDTIIKTGGIKLFDESISQGPNLGTVILDDVWSESQTDAYLQLDSRNVGITAISVRDGGMSDELSSLPLINIIGQAYAITAVSLDNTSQPGGAYYSSSASSTLYSAPVCIAGLHVLNGQPGNAITAGTVCSPSDTESFDGTNGLALTGLPVNFSAAASLKVPPHVSQGAANGDLAGASACASGTKTITFANAYSSTPVILIFDETTHGGASLTAKSASSFGVACSGASDAFDYLVVGNPN